MRRALYMLMVLVILTSIAASGCGKKEPAANAPEGAYNAVEPAANPEATAPATPGGAIKVKVGVVIPKSGPIATYGDEAENGIVLAASDAKGAGKIDPVLIIIDNGGTQQQTSTAVKQFIDSEKVDVILGPITSNNSIQAGDLAEAAKVPLVTPSATNIGVTQGRNYVFRTCYTDDVQGSTVANFAYDDLGARRAAILINSPCNPSGRLMSRR